jgi:molybdopterin converting factor small subunit
VTATVRIPTQLRPLTGGAGEVTAAGGTVREVLASLETDHPGIGARVLDERGELRRFVNLFVAEEDVRFLSGLDTPVAEGQTVSILPAVAGG